MLFLVIAAQSIDLISYGNLSYSLVFIAFLVGFGDLGLRDYFLSKDGNIKTYSGSFNLLFYSTITFALIAVIQLKFVSQAEQVFVIFFLLLGEAVALGVFHKVIYYKYQSENRLPKFSTCDIFFKSTPAALKVAVLLQTKDLYLSIGLSSLFIFIIYGMWLLKLKVFNSLDFRKSFYNFRALTTDVQSWGIYTISFFSFFLYFGADKLIVEYLLGVEQLAIYSASMSFMAAGQILASVLWSLYMPRLSRGESLWTYSKFILISIKMSAVLVFAYAVFAKYLFLHIYPNDYKEGALVLAVAAFYFIFRFPNVVIEIFYIVDGRYIVFVKLRALFGLVALALNFAFIPIFGIWWAALTLVISEMLLMVVSIFLRDVREKNSIL